MSNQVRVGIGVVVQYDNGVVLLKRKGSHGAGEWSFPGGHLEFGETVLECAIREVKEELGVELLGATPMSIWSEDSFPEDNKQYITLYVIGTAASAPKICEPDKASEIMVVSLSDALPEPVFSGVNQVWLSLKS